MATSPSAPYSISACFPAFNEAASLPSLVAAADDVLRSVSHDYEIIVVDDGSTDHTAEVLTGLSGQYPALRVIRHPRNRGYGAALITGLKSARKDLVFFSDADNQFDLHELPKLLALIDEVDLVTGFRGIRRDPFHRRLNTVLWNALIRVVLRVRVTDLNCAFKLFQRPILERVGLDQLTSTGAMINAELLARLSTVNARVREVEVRHYPRRYGQQTGASPKVILRAFKELIALRCRLRSRATRPPVGRVRDHGRCEAVRVAWTDRSESAVRSGLIRVELDRVAVRVLEVETPAAAAVDNLDPGSFEPLSDGAEPLAVHVNAEVIEAPRLGIEALGDLAEIEEIAPARALKEDHAPVTEGHLQAEHMRVEAFGLLEVESFQ